MSKDMDELMDAAAALLAFNADHHIYDDYAEDGCGHVNTWMSPELTDLFKRLEAAIANVKKTNPSPS